MSLDLEVELQQFDHGEIWGSTPIRNRRGFQEHTPVGKTFELIEEPRLSESWLIGRLSVMSSPVYTPSGSMGGALILKRTSWTIKPRAFNSKARSSVMPTPSPGSVSLWRSPPSIW